VFESKQVFKSCLHLNQTTQAALNPIEEEKCRICFKVMDAQICIVYERL